MRHRRPELPVHSSTKRPPVAVVGGDEPRAERRDDGDHEEGGEEDQLEHACVPSCVSVRRPGCFGSAWIPAAWAYVLTSISHRRDLAEWAREAGGVRTDVLCDGAQTSCVIRSVPTEVARALRGIWGGSDGCRERPI
jgi:hypothetical protein